MVWRQEIFLGNVVEEKEDQCKYEVCPEVSIPGLLVKASCRHMDDVSTLIEGTACDCACGEKLVWQQQRFHGDVAEERERECLKKICPVVNPLPGIIFKSECTFHEDLFAHSHRSGSARLGPTSVSQSLVLLQLAWLLSARALI